MATEELIIIIRNGGFNNLKELTQFAKDNLNLRDIKYHDYTFHNAFLSSEMTVLFKATFNMYGGSAEKLTNYLKEMGFVVDQWIRINFWTSNKFYTGI